MQKSAVTTCMGFVEKRTPLAEKVVLPVLATHFICGPSKKRTSVVWFLATKRRRLLCTIHAIPQAACRSGAMRLGPVGADRRRRYLRITLLRTPSPIEVVATSFIERGLDEVDPWSADRSP